MTGALAALPPEVLASVARHCEAEAPREAVGGLLLGPDGGWTCVPLVNAAAAESAHRAFAIAPGAWMALERRAVAAKAQIAALYHSHLDAPPALSAEDERHLLPGGTPLVEGLVAVVAEVTAGRCRGLHGFSVLPGRIEPVWSVFAPFGRHELR